MQRLAFGEAREAEGREVDARGVAVRDKFGHAEADRGRLLEARAAEPHRHVRAIDAGDAIKDRLLVGRHVVEAGVTARERRIGERWCALADPRADRREHLRRRPFVVRIHLRLRQRPAHGARTEQAEAVASRTEVRARFEVEEDEMFRSELNRPPHKRDFGAHRPHVEHDARARQQFDRPRPGGEHDTLARDVTGARRDATDAAAIDAQRLHPHALADRRTKVDGAAREALGRRDGIGVAAVRLVRGGTEIIGDDEWLPPP